MSANLPVFFRASPLPSNFRGNPQMFLDAIVARLSLATEEQLSLFVTGSTMPTSDEGPWLKDGITWWVWDNVLGTYKPEVLDPLSLRYILSETEPDHTLYDVWYKLDGTGKAQEIRTYSGGAWKSVYDDSFLAIEAEINAVYGAQNQSPWRSDSSVDQNATFAQTVTVVFGSEQFDPSAVFDGVSTFTAPEDGYYHFDTKTRIEKVSGSPTNITIQLQFLKNGFGVNNEIVQEDNSSGTGARTLEYGTNIQLSAGDTIQVTVVFNWTGYATWAVKGNGTFFSGFKLLTGGSF